MNEKISHLEACLLEGGMSYADSFKADIAIALGEFTEDNPTLAFLERLTSEQDITDWVNRLTSRIVMKHDEEDESVSDFVREYVRSG